MEEEKKGGQPVRRRGRGVRAMARQQVQGQSQLLGNFLRQAQSMAPVPLTAVRNRALGFGGQLGESNNQAD